MNPVKKSLLTIGLLATATNVSAGYEINLAEGNSITIGGFLAADMRFVSGDVAYRDYWIGSGSVLSENTSQLKLFANETRINMKIKYAEVTGFLELDFQASASGNEVITNGYNPRLRHAYINYQNVTVGQTWSTFMNTSSLAETVDFGGPHVAEPFVRNTQVRLTFDNIQLALENPESWGGDPSQDQLPDFIAKYTHQADWGNVSASALIRQLNLNADEDKTTVGFSVAGKINTLGKDDFRFSLSAGELGRYVGTTAAKDVFAGKAEKSQSLTLAYRHFWTEKLRSSIFYGQTKTDQSDANRSHYGINIFKDYTPNFSVGFELGAFTMDKDNSGDATAQTGVYKDAASNYVQLKAKFTL
jgi:hypothetical protein